MGGAEVADEGRLVGLSPLAVGVGAVGRAVGVLGPRLSPERALRHP